MRKPCRDNSLYPSALFQEISKQSLYALHTNLYSEVRPNKPVYFHIDSCLGTWSNKLVRFRLNIFRGLNRRRRYTLISIHHLMETKPNKSVCFHLHPNSYSEGKPDKLAHFCIDSLRKPSRTNRRASTQTPTFGS